MLKNDYKKYIIISILVLILLVISFLLPYIVISKKSSYDEANKILDEQNLKSAQLHQNETQCFQISDEKLRLSCTTAIKISSIKEKAVIEDNIEICQDFEDENLVQYCQDNYYLAKRYNFNDTNFCNNIINGGIKDECLQ